MKKSKKGCKIISMILMLTLMVSSLFAPSLLYAANEEEVKFADTRAYDSTNPVIDGVEFSENSASVEGIVTSFILTQNQ